jgi:preprotein translocase subunit SecG
MVIVAVGGILVLAVLLACVVVLFRRGRNTGATGPHGRSAAEVDGAARSASARASDRQGTGPF